MEQIFDHYCDFRLEMKYLHVTSKIMNITENCGEQFAVDFLRIHVRFYTVI